MGFAAGLQAGSNLVSSDIVQSIGLKKERKRAGKLIEEFKAKLEEYQLSDNELTQYEKIQLSVLANQIGQDYAKSLDELNSSQSSFDKEKMSQEYQTLRSGYCKEAIGEAYNLSEGKEIEIGYLAKKIVEYSGSKSEIIIGSKRKWDTKDRLLASTEKAYQLIGFKPSMDFDEGLKIAIAWMKSNLENIKLSAKFGPGISSANVDVIK